MASVLKRLTGINPLTLYAPSMSQRSTAEEEDPLYHSATSRGLVNGPTIFVDATADKLLGSDSFDAYIFWPRIKLKDERPDWMEQTLGRRRVRIPTELRKGSGMRLVQARREGEPASAIPVDQIIIDVRNDRNVLMLPTGKFWLRTIDQSSKVVAERHVTVR